MTLYRCVQLLIAKHGSLRKAASAVGVDAGYLLRLQHGLKTNPSVDILDRLGLDRYIIYRRKRS